MRIFIISLCIHLFTVLLIGQGIEQVSDFGFALETSNRAFPLTEPLVHYIVYSNWGIYPLYLKLLQHIFEAGTFAAVIVNAIIYATSSTLIYILCHMWLKNDFVGYIAALLYALWPSHLLYVIILTPEFPNILLTLLSLVFIKVAINRLECRSCYVFSGFAAVSLSLSGFFKSIDKIVLIDICIVMVLYVISRINHSKPDSAYSMRKKFSLFIAFLILYIISNKFIYCGLDYAYGTTVNRNPSMHFIYVGLNPYSYGTWNENVGSFYAQNVVNCNYDYKKANDITMQSLKKEINENHHLTPNYFAKKFQTAWGDNLEISWVDQTLTENSPILKKSSWWYIGNIITQSFWVLICLFIFLDSIYTFFKPDFLHSFLCMLILGFAILMFLLEVQPRYKCVLYPYLSILAADGIYQIMIPIKKRWKQVLNYFSSIRNT